MGGGGKSPTWPASVPGGPAPPPRPRCPRAPPLPPLPPLLPARTAPARFVLELTLKLADQRRRSDLELPMVPCVVPRLDAPSLLCGALPPICPFSPSLPALALQFPPAAAREAGPCPESGPGSCLWSGAARRRDDSLSCPLTSQFLDLANLKDRDGVDSALDASSSTNQPQSWFDRLKSS